MYDDPDDPAVEACVAEVLSNPDVEEELEEFEENVAPLVATAALTAAPLAADAGSWAWKRLKPERELIAENRRRRQAGEQPIRLTMRQQAKARGFALKGIPYHYDFDTGDPIEGPRPNWVGAAARAVARSPRVLGAAGKAVMKAPGALFRFAGRATKWARQGLSKAQIMKRLKESQVPKKLANAIADAAINVVAEEVGTSIREGGRKMRERAFTPGKGKTVKMASNPEEYEEEFYENDGPCDYEPNSEGRRYYVWVLDDHMSPIEDPRSGNYVYGPYTLYSAKTHARIAASKGDRHRGVSLGKDPEAKTFRVLRIYRAGSGENILEGG
jgi:hypothetical protein